MSISPDSLDAESTIELPEVDYMNLQCKYCLKSGLHWEKDKQGKYFMALPSGRKHSCRERLTGFTKLPKKVKKK